MKRDARSSDALHVWHVGIVIQVRVMLGLFLDDAEDTGRRLASLLAARYRRPQDPALGIVHGDPLAAQRNDRHDRLNGLTSYARLERRCGFFPTLCRARMIACRDYRGQAGDAKTRRPQPGLFVLRADEIWRHARPSCWAAPARAEKIIAPCDPSCQAQFAAISLLRVRSGIWVMEIGPLLYGERG